MGGGDMWWNLDNDASMKFLKGGIRHSMFAGALWIGGVDAGGQLKVAGYDLSSDQVMIFGLGL